MTLSQPRRLRVLTLGTLFPDASRPRLAPFVVRQTQALAALPDVDVRVVAPLGLPPLPLCLHPHYREQSLLPLREIWAGLDVLRPSFVHWPAWGSRFDSANLTRALRPVLAEMRRHFSFDIIDAQFFFPDGPAAVALGKDFAVPVSIKARGADIHYWGRRRTTGAQIVQAAHAADGLLSVSHALRQDMGTLGMPTEKIRVHYTGVDLENFPLRDRSEAKSALGMQDPLIVSVGALIPRKRQSLLIDALAVLPEAHLVLIGDGPERDRLTKQAAAAGLTNRVTFTGMLDTHEVAHWLCAADVMALPSASEGLANAWLEALACGTPIVITDAGGAQEVLQNQIGGRIVSATPAALAAALDEMIRTPPPRTACRAIAERFSWTKNAQDLRDHLLSLVGE